jgi:uncharacterized protein with beta-barrel porin domain
MMHLRSLKKQAALTAIVLFSCAHAQPLGLIGGENNTSTAAYAAFISSSGTATSITPGLPANGEILSVAINLSGQGIIGGQDNTGPAYAAFVSSSSPGTPAAITTGIAMGQINSVAINASNQAIIGGTDSSGPFAYAAFVSPSSPGTPTTITTGLSMGQLYTVAINNSSPAMAIIGGQSTSGTGPAYAAFVSTASPGSPTVITISGVSSNTEINSVAINASNQAIIGGRDNTGNTPYAALVTPATSTSPTVINTSLVSGIIQSVAINDSGQGIIGGKTYAAPSPAYAAFVVAPSGTPTSISGLPAPGIINSVAINASGQAIIGGQDFTGPAFAALVSISSPSTLTVINTGLSNGQINSVAINVYGQAIIGGQDNTGPAYAAIVSSAGVATPINTGLIGIISSVAINDLATNILPLLSNIPTQGLNGNNLIFANYINQYAPQDAFYFVPAVMDGTLAQALESAAPTRNAIALYTAGNNLFYLTTSLSNHLHNHSTRNRRAAQTPIAAASVPEDQLLASLTLPEEQSAPVAFISPEKREQFEQKCCIKETRNSTVWFEAIGALAYQKAQHQTPAFNPTTNGGILALDGKTSEHSRVGGGAAYLFTHIHEKQNAGHSDINQEDLFIYASWENKQFYVDGCVLGGLFQINQVRKIHMTGFEFESKSHPKGWQLLPHLELGYHHISPEGCELTVNPFVMVDWANAWQNSYNEKGSGPFNAAQNSHHSSLLRTEASLRLYETLFFDHWNLIFQEKVGYVNTHSFGTGKVNAFLVGSPGLFTVETLTSPQNLGVVEFAMIYVPFHSNYPSTTLFYQGEFGMQYQSHQVGLEISWNF